VLDKNRVAVELHHFTAPIAALQRGETSLHIGGDLDYTLKVMPNHHPALSTLVRLARRDKTNRPTGTAWPVECYFDRALRIAPDDARTWAVYADYLIQLRRTDEAVWAMNHAARLSPDDAMLAYNLGLVALELKDPDRAMQFARKAYSSGIDLPGLRSRLQSEGKWRDGP
jgi:Flp pilus assembly protein TadD